MFLDTHDADHIAAEKRGYFLPLEIILKDKDVKI
jgi:hypothetical protein